jgi:hypothetical protein
VAENSSIAATPKWGRVQLSLTAPVTFANPFQEARLSATFYAPGGTAYQVDGFWDEDDTWFVRFSPGQEGRWRFLLQLHYLDGAQVQQEEGEFLCSGAGTDTLFDRHGPLKLAPDKRRLLHADGTPFFWLADTAWNGPLRATPAEWDHYLATRVRQRFSAVQWVATHWRAAPTGDIDGNMTFTGREKIAINPAYFRRLDRYVEATAQAGLLNVPVVLWAIGSGATPEIDPGFGLPEEQAILLGRYIVARYGAYPVVWILAGDGKYIGSYAARWRRIGRAIFGGRPHAPVAMHCGGEQWPASEFSAEAWTGILGYQSGHGDADSTWDWIVNGPPATQWRKEPRLFALNLEPAYENHIAYHSKQPHSAHNARRAIYWSLLNAPTAGVTYGGHGVWGWDDGSGPSVDHPRSGTPLPWQQALTMPGAEQMAHLESFFNAIPWWTLAPAPELLASQPGAGDVKQTVLAAASPDRRQVVIYLPEALSIRIHATELPTRWSARWHDPRTGATQPAAVDPSHPGISFTAPGPEDWLLTITAADAQ